MALVKGAGDRVLGEDAHRLFSMLRGGDMYLRERMGKQVLPLRGRMTIWRGLTLWRAVRRVSAVMLLLVWDGFSYVGALVTGK
jgi:hypothetical protein